MTRMHKTVQIKARIEQVFDYVTTPGNWPEWHPSSLEVSGATDHSLEPGEVVTEEYRVAGGLVRVAWRVRERVAPWRWTIEDQAKGDGEARITYTLTPREDGTNFERELVYTMPNLLLAPPDWLMLRRRVERESVDALRH